MTFLLFLILCTQVFGVAANYDFLNDDFLDFHVTQNIFNIKEIYNISLENGRPVGQAKFLGERIFEWELGRRFVPKIISSIGTNQKVSFCNQKVERDTIQTIFFKVSACNEFGELMNNKNILYFYANKKCFNTQMKISLIMR